MTPTDLLVQSAVAVGGLAPVCYWLWRWERRDAEERRRREQTPEPSYPEVERRRPLHRHPPRKPKRRLPATHLAVWARAWRARSGHGIR